MFEDVRYAFRQLRKNPGFAAAAVTTLSLGIGAAAAMLGLIQGVLLSPPPYASPDRLVLVSPARVDGQPYEEGSTIGQWIAWRDRRAVEAPALYRWTFNFLVLADGSESLGGMVVTRNYFSVLGIKPMLGREFTEAETARPKVAPTAIILGYDLWQRKFNGDPQIIGKSVRISRQPAPLPVVGVMPPGVRFLPDPAASSEPNYDLNARVDFWIGTTPDETQPKARGWNAIARLRDGATLAQAQAELTAVAAGQARTDPDLAALTSTVTPVQEALNHDGRRLLVPLFGSVALVFFIACANVAGLLLARGLQRQQEYAMRAALGAGRRRLFRQVLTESVVLALVGALLGAGVAAGIVTVFKAIAGHAVPRADAVTIGWPVFAFAFLAASIAAGVAGLLPAARASLPDRVHGLKGGTRSSAGRTERRLLSGVATLQIVLTMALLAGAALLIRTADNLARVQPGYGTENILAMTVTSVQRDKWKEFHTQALERVSALPGVAHAAFVWGLPLTGNKWGGAIELPGHEGSSKPEDRLNLPLRSVTPDYFAVMGMRLVQGRGFRPSDNDSADAPRVAVINATLARRYFDDEARAIGRPLRFPGDTGKPTSIVGVVADTRTDDLSQPAQPEIYLSFWQSGPFSKHLVLRATGDPLPLAALVRRELRAVDPTSAVEHVTTMTEIRRASMADRTFAMRLLTAFAGAATLLAVVGLYGVLSLSVNSRTKEIAVRKAIGARRHQIVGLVLGEGSRLILVGLTLGTLAALVLGRLLETLLFDVKPADPLALAAAALLFALVALAACLLPAYRAGRVDLMEALRQE
jgi:putative ABC transport system permease protein